MPTRKRLRVERVLDPRIPHPAVLTLLDQFRSPKEVRKADRRRLVTLLRPKAPRMAERLVDDTFTALDEQTVAVLAPPRPRPQGSSPKLAKNLTACIDRRKQLRPQHQGVVEGTPSLSELLKSTPGIGIKTRARILFDVGDGSAFPATGHLAAYCIRGPGSPADPGSRSGSRARAVEATSRRRPNGSGINRHGVSRSLPRRRALRDGPRRHLLPTTPSHQSA